MDKDVAVIACDVMREELEAAAGGAAVQFHFLDQGLHRTPQKMAALIQEKIELLSSTIKKVVLGYGLCSKGICGVRSLRQELIVPRCHDCIALFFGSVKNYSETFKMMPGTYYLTPGWVAARKDPLGIIYNDYAIKHGLETAMWCMEEELKHYTHIALINTGVGDIERLRERTRDNCAVLNKQYYEVQGSIDYFTELIHGPYDEENFITFLPGKYISEEVFLDACSCNGGAS